MSQFDLTDDQKAIQEVARRFTAEAIVQRALTGSGPSSAAA